MMKMFYEVYPCHPPTQKYLRFLIEKLISENIYRDEVSRWDLDFLIPSAQLHDVEKIAISDAILNKPDKLTPEEFEEMKNMSSSVWKRSSTSKKSPLNTNFCNTQS